MILHVKKEIAILTELALVAMAFGLSQLFLSGFPSAGSMMGASLQALCMAVLIITVACARKNRLGLLFRRNADTGARGGDVACDEAKREGRSPISEFRDADLSRLLGREPIELDEAGICDFIRGRSVLVSGAAGSIGSELCRQVARFGPERLILLDIAETPLFYLHRELLSSYPELTLDAVIGDVRSRNKIQALFSRFLPDVVFHAAAYKHVPMMEENRIEAVANNVGGTMVMADAANRFGVGDFVMISTDKAVNPANVMGASKRAAEIYVQALSGKSATRFTTVRFGNVLGSNGSVVPLFMEQIRGGGPVTVTDPDITRYFMTIPEATQLVLQAGCIGKGGEVFVLDMGEPVRILDLAEGMIRLSGRIPYREIDIVFTGLRAGEKMFEELLADGEGIVPTTHEKIRVVAAVEADFGLVLVKLRRLLRQAEQLDTPGVMRSLRELVPEFRDDSLGHAAMGAGFYCVKRVDQRRDGATGRAKVIPMMRSRSNRG